MAIDTTKLRSNIAADLADGYSVSALLDIQSHANTAADILRRHGQRDEANTFVELHMAITNILNLQSSEHFEKGAARFDGRAARAAKAARHG